MLTAANDQQRVWCLRTLVALFDRPQSQEKFAADWEGPTIPSQLSWLEILSTCSSPASEYLHALRLERDDITRNLSL